MNIKTISSATALWAVASAAGAQGFAGGELAIETYGFAEAGDLGYTAYSGALEFEAGAGFAIALDLTAYGFNGFGGDGSNATLHGIYGMGGGTALGLFYGRDGFDGADAEVFGIEGMTAFRGAEVEGWIGHEDGAGRTLTLAGLSGGYALTPTISATAGLGYADAEDDGYAIQATLGGAYRMPDGPSLYAELGRIETDDASFRDDETYLGIGAKIGFGPFGGTRFGPRSLFEIVPGL